MVLTNADRGMDVLISSMVSRSEEIMVRVEVRIDDITEVSVSAVLLLAWKIKRTRIDIYKTSAHLNHEIRLPFHYQNFLLIPIRVDEDVETADLTLNGLSKTLSVVFNFCVTMVTDDMADNGVL